MRWLLLACCAVLLCPARADALHRREGAAHAAARDRAEDLARAGRTHEAAALLEELAERARTDEGRATARLRRAEVLGEAGDWPAAREAYRRLERELPGHRAAVRAAFHGAVLDEDRLGRGGAARAAFRRIVEEHPDSIQAPRALARLVRDRSDADRRALYRELYRRVGRTSLGPVILMRCGREDGSAQSLDCLRRLARSHPDSVLVDDALFLAAKTYARAGNDEAAASLYRTIIDGRPSASGRGPFPSHLRDDSLLALAALQATAGEDDAAVASWRRLLEEHPTSRLCDDALRALARHHAAAGRREAAAATWRRLLVEHAQSRHAAEARRSLE